MKGANVLQAISVIAGLSIGACSSFWQQDYSSYRESIKLKMSDPASAEFRNEHIRVIWSKEGDRLKLYCAEVNGNNAYGGKGGFQPAEVVVSAKSSKGDDGGENNIYKFGYVGIGRNATTYGHCLREDTQRANDCFFCTFASMTDDYAAAVKLFDQSVPVLSNDVAPELRT